MNETQTKLVDKVVDRRKGERRKPITEHTASELNILYLKNDRRLVDRRKK